MPHPKKKVNELINRQINKNKKNMYIIKNINKLLNILDK